MVMARRLLGRIVSTGIWVRQILAKPDKTKGAYAGVFTEDLSWNEMLQIWSEVTGKPAQYVHCTTEEFNNVWGPAGEELCRQFKWGEMIPDWLTQTENYVSKEDLEITEASTRVVNEASKRTFSRLVDNGPRLP